MKIFKVRSYFTGNGYKHYRYYCDGFEWTLREIEDLEGVISFIFSPNVNEEDQCKILRRWKHKMVINE